MPDHDPRCGMMAFCGSIKLAFVAYAVKSQQRAGDRRGSFLKIVPKKGPSVAWPPKGRKAGQFSIVEIGGLRAQYISGRAPPGRSNRRPKRDPEIRLRTMVFQPVFAGWADPAGQERLISGNLSHEPLPRLRDVRYRNDPVQTRPATA